MTDRDQLEQAMQRVEEDNRELAYDYFTKPVSLEILQADSPTHTGYQLRLTHAILVLITYNCYTRGNALENVYSQAQIAEAKETFDTFFNSIANRAETGAYDRVACNQLMATFESLLRPIYNRIDRLRSSNNSNQTYLGHQSAKSLRLVMGARFDQVAQFTGYAMPALYWHLRFGHMTYSHDFSNTLRGNTANQLHGWADHDQDDVEILLHDNDYRRCDDCCDYTHYDLIHTPYDSNDDVCQHCIDNNYTYSSHYDQYVHGDNVMTALDRDGEEVYVHEDDDDFSWDDDEDMRVHYDFRGRKPQLLGSYHNRARVNKQPFMHSDWTRRNDRFMGVELEVEVKDGYIDEHVTRLNDAFNGGEVGKRVWFEADGSLTHGFEIITNPMGLDGHTEMWSLLNDSTLTRGLRSHDTSTCGLHVHVSRKNMHNMQINKMNVFLNHPDNAALVKAVARRYDVNYARIAQKRLATAHKYDIERRDALNITNEYTVEFRIFKGTIKPDTLLAAIEFANAVVNFTMPASPAGFNLSTLRFIDFIDSASQRSETKHLRNHLKAQGIMS